MDNPNVKGSVAEQAIVLAATKLEIPVLRPVGEHGRTDLALEIGDRLYRVQVKWGRLSTTKDVVVVQIRTSRCTPNGYVHGTYSEREIDLIGVYCGELNRCFLLPISLVAGKHVVHLRLSPARNAQRACINLADHFEFEGAVAQLARASAWHAEGRGFESPQLHSSSLAPTPVGSNPFRDHLGYWLERAAEGEHLLVTHRGNPRVKVTPAAPNGSPTLWPLPSEPTNPLPFNDDSAGPARAERSS